MTPAARKKTNGKHRQTLTRWIRVLGLSLTLCALVFANPAWAVSISLTSPSNSVLAAPATITISASASPSAGRRILRVDFFKGITRIGTVTTAPYSITWSNVPRGTYIFTATAIDSGGSVAVSNPVAVRVDSAPTVSLISPLNNAVFAPGANIALSAAAADADEVVAKVDFFQGGALLGTQFLSPYTLAWNSVPTGRYTLTARVTDLVGLVTTSAPVTITVDGPPTVSITTPANNTNFTAPATVTVVASASDADGNVTRVDFFDGGRLVGTASTTPGSSSYSVTLTDMAEGAHALTAIATDDLGVSATSGAVMVTVNAAAAQIYYIQTDHLNTPRLIADQAGNTVWRNDNTEPFGDSVPNEDPNNTGNVFDFPLGLSGYYRDRETGTFYAKLRDAYDPVTGRFPESDPIGLRGGINTYAYVRSNPLGFIDPDGLIAWPVGVPFPRPAPPVPGPGGSSGGQPGGSGLPPELDPNQPRPPTFPEIRMPPFPPSSPPPQGSRGCEGILETCLKGANACPGVPLRSTVAALCFALYVACKAITPPWDPPPTFPSP
jgi:RHS repeat-associated protein